MAPMARVRKDMRYIGLEVYMRRGRNTWKRRIYVDVTRTILFIICSCSLPYGIKVMTLFRLIFPAVMMPYFAFSNCH